MSNKRSEPPDCGTSAGYWWHRRVDGQRGLQIDPACRAAYYAATVRSKRIRTSAINTLIGRHHREFDQLMTETRQRFALAEARRLHRATPAV